jgi:SAM-dependent methyltransferase
MSAAAPRSCPLCDIPPVRTVRLRNGARLLRCPRCLLGWWPWPAFDPAAFYDQAYFQSAREPKGYDDYAALEPGVRRTARSRLRRIEALRRRSQANRKGEDRRPRLLEIGCGTGCFLDEARRGDWDVCGVEVGEYAAEQARQRDLIVTCEPIEDARLDADSYDCVALWDVIEHLRDPVATLGRAAAALRPGGVLALSTGDVTSLCARLCGPSWHLFNLPEHLFFFSPRCLRGMLTRADCRIRCVTREVNWVPLSYALERIRKTAFAAAKARTRSDRLIPATLFDVVGVYAVRCGAAGACPSARSVL